MPSYAEPLGRLGGYAGGLTGAAGGSLLGRLGQVLEPLDYPRQALYNLVRSGYRGLTGQGSASDILSAIPGALGAALAGGLTATGVGAPLGIAAGSLLAGVGQGIGKAEDQPDFEASTPGDLLKALGGNPDSLGGNLASMGLGLATDPLTFAGGLGGAEAGSRAGQAGGRYLEDVARGLGPRYATGISVIDPWQEAIASQLAEVEKLPWGAERVEKALALSRAKEHLQDLRVSPELNRILAEVEPGSSVIGSGAEGAVLKRPSGGITRIAGGENALDIQRNIHGGDIPPPPPVNDPLVLQPARDVTAGPFRVSHYPFMDIPGGGVASGAETPYDLPDFAEWQRAKSALRSALEAKGYRAEDLHYGNFGRTPDRRYLITDPGTVNLPGGEVPPEPLAPRPAGPISNVLLKLLGGASPEEMQAELNRSLQQVPQGGWRPPDIAAGPRVLTAEQEALANLPTDIRRPPMGGWQSSPELNIVGSPINSPGQVALPMADSRQGHELANLLQLLAARMGRR